MSLGGMINAGFGSDKPDLKKIEIVKNEALQNQINQGIAGNAGLMNFSDQSVNDFLSLFGRNTPRVQRFADQGVGVVDRIYAPGGLEADLAGLRAGRRTARMDATKRTLDQLAARDKVAAASLGIPGGSSYRNLMNARLMRDANIDAELEDTAQQRADYMTVLGQRLGNLGTRQQVVGMPEQRFLTGVQTVGGMRGVPLQNLGALSQLDQANKWYGLYKERDTLERIADFGDEGMKTIGQLASIYGSVAGGMGAMCWVARAAYGDDNPKWLMFRHWLLTEAPKALLAVYLRHGPALAEIVKADAGVAKAVREWMDGKIVRFA